MIKVTCNGRPFQTLIIKNERAKEKFFTLIENGEKLFADLLMTGKQTIKVNQTKFYFEVRDNEIKN